MPCEDCRGLAPDVEAEAAAVASDALLLCRLAVADHQDAHTSFCSVSSGLKLCRSDAAKPQEQGLGHALTQVWASSAWQQHAEIVISSSNVCAPGCKRCRMHA